MTYDQQEKFKELTNFISTHTHNRGIDRADRKALEENFKWNASLFFAKVIHLAKLKDQELTLEEFNQFKKDYEDRNGQIDTDTLFQKYWLRNVLGKIKIAGTVFSACYHFKRISKYYNELDFIFNHLNKNLDNKEKLTKEYIDKKKTEYEDEKTLFLDTEWIQKQLSTNNKSDNEAFKINTSNEPFLKHWKEFRFLLTYKEHLSNNVDKGLKINKNEFEKLHQSFRQFYNQTPSIDKIREQVVLNEKDGFYYFDFYNTEVSYWSSLGDQITAFYWQLLIEENSFFDDKERIERLLTQVLYWESPSGFLTYSLDESKKRFLDAATDMVINETDLDGIESEFKKVSIDGCIGSREIESLFHGREEFDDFSLNNIDHFELFESLANWEKKSHTTYLYGQSSREELTFLNKLIVAYDYESEREETEDEDSPIIHHYKRVFALLEKSLTKPSLLWDIKCFVLMCRREFIPHLVKDSQYTSLAFQFIDRMGECLLQEDKETTHNKFWVKSIELALFSIRSVGKDNAASKLIFQIYRQLNSNKYDIPYNRQKHAEKVSRKQKEEKEKAVLSLIEDSFQQNHQVHGGSSQFLLPQAFNELVKLFINLRSKALYNNGTVSFPMLQWDGLAWLMKCSTYWKYKSQFEIIHPDINTLTNSFFKLYIDRIEVTKVKRYNFFDNQEEIGLPNWSEKIERLEYIEWIYPVYFIYKRQKINRFLNLEFDFKPTSEYYNKENDFTAYKLRTHIGLLLQVLGQLVLPTIPYGFEKDEIQEIKSRIEQQIIDYLKWHIKDVPKEGRVDLFDYNKEKAFKSSEKEALLPQIARALNWFSKKEQIIDAIIETQDIIKILTIAKWVTSTGIKQKLIEKIKQSDIKAFLKETNWIPEVQHTLLEISKYPQLINEINQVVEFWEKKVSRKNREYEIQLYQTKMLLAYFHNDEQELNNIKEPNSPLYRVRELSYRDHKQFYRAFIRLEKDSKSSHIIFSQLSSQYPQYPVFALNKMAAKINIARANNSCDIYREALEEWNVYASQQKEFDEEDLGSTFYANKLIILLKIREYNELDNVFSELDMPYQMLPNILESKIESLIDRKRIEEASMLLEEAENYHQFSGDDKNEFIKTMKIKIEGIDNVQLLNSYYTRIFTSPPNKLIRIFPPDLNGQIQLQGFLVTEIVSAAKMMLDKVVSISDIEGEDKYNDVIEILLNSKMNPWGWCVTDQSRGGYSDSEIKTKKKQPGERDFKFFNKKDTFGICEAFIYRTPAPAKKHLKKVFNYYHQRDSLIMLIYDLNEPTKAAKNWNTYLKSILPKTEYPKGYEYINCEDVSNDFGYKNSAVRIAKSKHKGELNLYHIFVNINYKVNA